MKKGTFLIVNEPTDETVDRMLQVTKDKCDVYPALVYIPKYNKKTEKGLFCILTIFAQIALYALMAYFFKYGYVAMIPFEVFFFTMYAKEYVTTLYVQFIYLAFQLFFCFAITLLAFLPEDNGTRSDFQFLIPTLQPGTMGLFGFFFGLFTIIRLLLVASYHTHLFYSNLRDKFMDGKVVLQPA